MTSKIKIIIDRICTYPFYLIWQLSEWSGIGLGRFAPWVFERMIGAKGEVKDDQ